MAEHYIPSADAEFHSWQRQLVVYATAHAAELGLSPADITNLTAGQAAWETDFPAHIAARATADAATMAKNESKARHVATIRAVARQIQADSAVDDGHRRGMGLPVRDRTRTPVNAPGSHPQAIINRISPGQLRFRIWDSESQKRALPKGVRGCEIWMKAGGQAPVGLSECRYLATSTRSTFVRNIEPGREALWFILVWVNTRAERGPSSPTFEA